jgi:hypothetical protein
LSTFCSGTASALESIDESIKRQAGAKNGEHMLVQTLFLARILSTTSAKLRRSLHLLGSPVCPSSLKVVSMALNCEGSGLYSGYSRRWHHNLRVGGRTWVISCPAETASSCCNK